MVLREMYASLGRARGDDVTIHRPLTILEDILERQSDGESVGRIDRNASYQSILVLAARYLQPGPDTEYVQGLPLDWSLWPMEEAHRQGSLPKYWQVMGKGLLLNFFKWNIPNMPQPKRRA